MSVSKKGFLDSIEIKSPCSEKWNEMRGNEQIRFCSHCAKDVHNLSKFTRKEARQLIAKSNGAICVQYVRRPDGRIETLKNQLHQITRQTKIAAGVLGASLSVASVAYAQVTDTNPPSPDVSVTQTNQTDKEKDAKGETKTESADGTISGTIKDPAGAVVPNISLTITGVDVNFNRTIQSDAEGSYHASQIPPGIYNVSSAATSGFMAQINNNVRVDSARETTVDFTLSVGQYAVAGGAMFVEYEHPLMKAVSNDNLEEVKTLIARGANVNAKDKNYDDITALFVAVENGNTEIAETLLNFGAKANARSKEKLTPLMHLDSDAGAELVRLLIKHGAKVNAIDSEGNTVLHHLAEYESAEVLRILINEGADVDAQNKDGDTALIVSAENENLENVETLLKIGASVNLRNKKGETALTLAEENEYKEIVEMLLAYGAAR